MNSRILLPAAISLLLSACIQQPVFKGDDYAFIRSNYPIVRVNGDEVEPVYKLDIEAGETSVVIVYHTYRNDYFCNFNWTTEANAVYEVTNQENRYPLTLFRWVRTNSLWASRLDPLDPEECVKQPRRAKDKQG